MTLLLHACCGPCLGGVFPQLDDEKRALVVFWDNPNIHPYLEYSSRFESFEKLVQEWKMPFLVSGDYGLERFLQALNGSYGPQRCRLCFSLRLTSSARKAKEIGAEAFSTTLLVSPYQDHETLQRVGCETAQTEGIPFYYQDFRPGFRETYEVARREGLYRQRYCGCIFSEFERFSGDKKKDQAKAIPHPKTPIGEPLP